MGNKSQHKRLINIFVSNHKDYEGVSDLCEAIKQIFEKSSYTVMISDGLKVDCANLIIDEFTDKNFVTFLTSFKANNPQAVLIVLVTEFITSRGKKVFQ